MTDEQQKEFEALYKAYYTYVFKYHVFGYVEDFDDPKYPLSYIDRESFAEELEETGMMIKVREGY